MFMTDTKNRYTRAELEHFQAIIVQMREGFRQDLAALTESAQSPSWSEGSDHSQVVESSFVERSFGAAAHEQNTAMISRQTKILRALDEALKRIERGEYGRCVICGNLIDKERLQIVPHTQHCMGCKVGRTPGSADVADRGSA